jgi:hypothetical protein
MKYKIRQFDGVNWVSRKKYQENLRKEYLWAIATLPLLAILAVLFMAITN